MSTWSGSDSRRARKHFAPLVEALQCYCPKCGFLVYPDQRWHSGHQTDRAMGGGNEFSNLAPEHGKCNESAGGRLAQAMRKRPEPPKVKRRAW